MTCPLCQSNSSRYNLSLECCQFRFVAAMPKERRQSYYQQVKRERGAEAANEVIAAVNEILQQRRVLKLSTKEGEK